MYRSLDLSKKRRLTENQISLIGWEECVDWIDQYLTDHVHAWAHTGRPDRGHGYGGFDEFEAFTF